MSPEEISKLESVIEAAKACLERITVLELAAKASMAALSWTKSYTNPDRVLPQRLLEAVVAAGIRVLVAETEAALGLLKVGETPAPPPADVPQETGVALDWGAASVSSPE